MAFITFITCFNSWSTKLNVTANIQHPVAIHPHSVREFSYQLHTSERPNTTFFKEHNYHIMTENTN